MELNNRNKFPQVIYFCNKMIGEKEIEATNNWKRLNPDFEIKLYDDEMCKQFLHDTYGQLYCDIFDFLKDGPIKADFWRICILYANGGVYSDIDNKPLVGINDFVEPGIDFVTCSSASNFHPYIFTFNPNLIICSKGNEIIKRSIDWYINKYNNKDPYVYWNYSVVQSFTDIMHIDNFKKEDGIYHLDNMKIQIIKEVYGRTQYDAHNIYKGVKIFYNRYDNWNYYLHKFV